MMLKMKICTTVFVLYEIIAVLLLHNPWVCRSMFGIGFCTDSVFKYFIALAAVPALVLLIVMWVMHIIHAIRRRHSFMYRAQEAFEDVTASIKKTLRESVSGKDIEKYIVAAMLAGVKKYSDKNPDAAKKFSKIIDAVIGGTAAFTAGRAMDAHHDADDDDDDDAADTTSRRRMTAARGRTQKRTAARTRRTK